MKSANLDNSSLRHIYCSDQNSGTATQHWFSCLYLTSWYACLQSTFCTFNFVRSKEVWRRSGTMAGPVCPFPLEGQQVANSQERMDSVPQKAVPLRMPLFFSWFRDSSGSNRNLWLLWAVSGSPISPSLFSCKYNTLTIYWLWISLNSYTLGPLEFCAHGQCERHLWMGQHHVPVSLLLTLMLSCPIIFTYFRDFTQLNGLHLWK